MWSTTTGSGVPHHNACSLLRPLASMTVTLRIPLVDKRRSSSGPVMLCGMMGMTRRLGQTTRLPRMSFTRKGLSHASTWRAIASDLGAMGTTLPRSIIPKSSSKFTIGGVFRAKVIAPKQGIRASSGLRTTRTVAYMWMVLSLGTRVTPCRGLMRSASWASRAFHLTAASSTRSSVPLDTSRTFCMSGGESPIVNLSTLMLLTKLGLCLCRRVARADVVTREMAEE
mmetsp:Transcript_20711/g.57496  ORF Transcript_20711/g.57496 Transcript_20711/m.57496 type:complete len:226 (-) Transcript_20711:837-1514(-)